MKKMFKFLPFIMLCPLLTTACNDKKQDETKYKLTYGSLFDDSLTEISTYANLEKKIASDEETFILAIHYGSSPSCGCWRNFENQLKKYIKSMHVRIYDIDTFKIDDDNPYGIATLEKDEPALYIFSKGKTIAKYQYGNSKLESFFTDMESIKSELETKIEYPDLYYVNEEYLNENLINNPVDKAAIFFMRNGCGDCQYCLPHFMVPYVEQNDLKVNVWLYDLQDLYDTAKDTTYVEIKNKYGLTETGNAVYGYSTGVVPTTQYYENGQLVDASVYFNDTLTKSEDKITITDSYYTSERAENLHYLDAVETKVLKGMEVKAEDTVYYEEWDYTAWNQVSSAKYHDAFLKAFYDYYLK